MIIYNKQSKTEYSVTPGGTYMEMTTTPIGTLVRSTPDVHKFLSWIMQFDIDKDVHEKDKAFQLVKIMRYWKTPNADSVHTGTFDVAHYNKVVKARKYKLKKTNACKSQSMLKRKLNTCLTSLNAVVSTIKATMKSLMEALVLHR